MWQLPQWFPRSKCPSRLFCVNLHRLVDFPLPPRIELSSPAGWLGKWCSYPHFAISLLSHLHPCKYLSSCLGNNAYISLVIQAKRTLSHETSLAAFLPSSAQLIIENRRRTLEPKGPGFEPWHCQLELCDVGEDAWAPYVSISSSVRCCNQPQRVDVRIKQLHLNILK